MLETTSSTSAGWGERSLPLYGGQTVSDLEGRFEREAVPHMQALYAGAYRLVRNGAILKRTTVHEVRTFARSLCSELVDLTALSAQLGRGELEGPIVEWLTDIRNRAQALLDRHDRTKRRKIEDMLASTVKLANLLLARGEAGLHEFPEADRKQLERDPGNSVAGWEKSDFVEATALLKYIKELPSVDDIFFKHVFSLLTPFVLSTRSSFTATGWLSFDGLLARARTLLRDHPVVRERVKQEYRDSQYPARKLFHYCLDDRLYHCHHVQCDSEYR